MPIVITKLPLWRERGDKVKGVCDRLIKSEE